MKHIFTGFSLIGAFALLALAVGCTGMQTQSKENLLIAAGFKTIVPSTAAQQQKLQALPPDKMALVRKDGKTYYVFPDAVNNRAYVGGPKQYHLTSSSVWRINWLTKILKPRRFIRMRR